MAEIARIAIVFLLVVFPQIASANTGILRGGEHDDFTRITLSVEDDVRQLRQDQIGPKLFALVVSPPLTNLDSSRLFERIGQNRLKSFVQTESGLAIGVNCDCQPSVTLVKPNLIVVDIHDAGGTKLDALPSLPTEAAVLPMSSRNSTPQNDLFKLDHSLVERINRSVSSQLVDAFHIKGFAELAHAVSDPVNTDQLHLRTVEAVLRDGLADRCALPDNIWDHLPDDVQTSEATSHDKGSPFDLSDLDHSDALLQAETIRLLAQGRLEEARITKMQTEDFAATSDAYDLIEGMLVGSTDVGGFRFGDCNPLDDLLIAGMRHPSDIPNHVKITTLVTFEKLSTGLQVLLFPRLEDLFAEISEHVFSNLTQHVHAEKALASRRPVELGDADQIADPDGLAALTVELRGTEREVESWNAAFLSFLEHGRYFDALNALSADLPLAPVDRLRAVTDLADHLVKHADTVTFVEIALAFVPRMDPQPPHQTLAAIQGRLMKEGFGQTVLSPAMTSDKVSGNAAPMALSNRIDVGPDNTLPLEPKATDNDASPRTSDTWSVKMARTRVDASQKLRQELSARLSR